jgi:hypothetical protein
MRGADRKVPRGAGGLGKGATSGGALSLEHFGVPLFDCVFLKNFQLKCAE